MKRKIPPKSKEDPYVLKKDYRNAFKRRKPSLWDKYIVAAAAFITTYIFIFLR